MRYKIALILPVLLIAIFFRFPHDSFAAETTLGGLSLDAYCNHIGQVNSNPVNSTNWRCNPSGALINITLACQWQYNSNAFGKQSDPNNPYTWKCYTSDSPPPSPFPTPSASTSPSSQKELRIFDNNDNELGLYIDRTSFFYVPLGKIIVLSDSGQIIGRGDVWYQSTDCTGTPYAPSSEGNYRRTVNEILPIGPGKYYSIDRGTSTTIRLNSFQRYNGSNFPCKNETTIEPAWTMTPVTLPFVEPIALPLQYKYQ